MNNVKKTLHYLIINHNSQTFFPYRPEVIMRGAAIRPRNQKEHHNGKIPNSGIVIIV